MELKGFFIPFKGLKIGRHQLDYQLDNAFFEEFGYEDFNDANIGAKVTLEKSANMMDLDFSCQGTINVNGDLTNEPFDQDLKGQMHMVVKFGDEFNDDDDELLILPHGEYQLNVAQYLYEMVVLAVPQKRVHPGVLDGTLNSPALDRLNELRPNNEKKQKGEPDPRWDGLKKLLTKKG